MAIPVVDGRLVHQGRVHLLVRPLHLSLLLLLLLLNLLTLHLIGLGLVLHVCLLRPLIFLPLVLIILPWLRLLLSLVVGALVKLFKEC